MYDESNATQLTALFPDIERDILETMLAHFGSIELLVAALLDDANFEDDAIARNLQEGLDEEMARTMQQELNQEGAGQSTASAGQAGVAGQTASATMAAGTKRLLQPFQERLRRLSTKSRGSQGQRLLDDTMSSPEYNEPLQPLQPLYSPPAPQILAPAPLPQMPSPAPPAMATTSSTRTGGDASGASAESSSTNKYTSRVERARLANRAKSLSVAQPLPSSVAPITASQNAPSPVIPPLAQGPVEVPVGELI